ncbi:MAG TPA: flagellar basal body rod protein FlgB [Caulobacteraceae bacterium]|nr:flagellar basal body rod protein FlgB [Caulobacteraceae bacterium]
MRLDDIPLLAMLKGRMGYLTQRQKVIAENVANADTVGFTPRDLKPQSFDQMVGVARGGGTAGGPATLVRTSAGHMAAPGQGGTPGPYKADKTPDSETRLDGNSVVLEEQMLKMAESRMAYDAAIGFYQKSMNLLRMAARAPGR